MALTGRFAADFSDFQTAVTQATVSLKGFQVGGAQVEAQLNRVAESLSGNQIKQQAELAATAVERLGGAGGVTAGLLKLTDDELARVGATAQEAEAKFQALGQEVPANIQAVADATRDLGKETQDAGISVEGFLAKYFSGEAILEGAKEAFRALTEFITSSLKVYGEAELAQTRLTAALKAQGTLTPDLTKDYVDLADSYEHTTVNSHALIEETEALLVQVGDVGPAQMNKALQAVTDLSAGLGIDLHSATMLVAKAFEGKTTTMARYGVVLDETRVKAEGITYVLDTIEQKFGGQAGAVVDTYSGHIQQLGNAWDDLKEKVGEAIAKDPFIESELTGLTVAVDYLGQKTEGYTPTITDYWAAWADPTGTAAFITGWLNATSKTMADLNHEIGQMKPPPASQFTQGDQALADQKTRDAAMHEAALQQEADWKAQGEAAKEYAKAVQAVEDQISGAALAKRAKELNDALVLLERSGPLTGQQLKFVSDAAMQLYKAGATLSPQLIDIAVQVDGLLPPVKDATLSLEELGTRVYATTIPTMALLGQQIQLLQNKLSPFPPVIADLGTKLEKGADGFAAAAKGIDDTNKAMHQMTVAGLTDMAKGFKDLATNAGGAFGGVLKDVSALGDTLTSSVKSGMKDFSDSSKAFTAGNTLSGITSMVGGISSIASAALAAGEAIDKLWNHFFGSAGRDAVNQFAATFQGGYAGLQQQLDALGPSGQQLWVTLTQGTGKNNPTQAAANIKAVTDALNTLHSAQSSQIDSLTSSIQSFGGAIDPALDPYIAKLQQAGQLTAAQATSLQQLEGGGVPTWQQMDAVAQKYNLTIGQLGPTFQAQKLDSQFQTVIDDMDVLSRGGADMSAVLTQVGSDGTTALSGLGTQVASLIDQSQQYGVDVPANMKPAAQALIDQGLLLDANGQKITDINQIKFGETMQTSLDTLNTTLEKLIATMTGGPNSLLGSLNTIGATTVSPTIKPVYDNSNLPPGMQAPQGTLPPGASAGSGTYAGAATPPAASVNVTVQTNLDGRQVAEAVVPHIPVVVQSYGLA